MRSVSGLQLCTIFATKAHNILRPIMPFHFAMTTKTLWCGTGAFPWGAKCIMRVPHVAGWRLALRIGLFCTHGYTGWFGNLSLCGFHHTCPSPIKEHMLAYTPHHAPGSNNFYNFFSNAGTFACMTWVMRQAAI